MHRFKTTSNQPLPRPGGSLLAGMMIGTVIMTMSTQAIVLGAGAALQNGTLKRN